MMEIEGEVVPVMGEEVEFNESLQMLGAELPFYVFDFGKSIALTEGSLSESGSITPTTLGEEFPVDMELLSEMLNSITEEQKQELDKKIAENVNSFKEKTKNYQEQREKLDLYKQTRLSSNISEIKTQAEIKEEEVKLTKIEEARDEAINTYTSLTERLKETDSVLEKLLGQQVIAIKTYGENANNNDYDVEQKVWRFALIAENLSHLVGDKLERTVLHPLEIVLLKQVFKYFLTTLNEAPGGVIFDIFKRAEEQVIAKNKKTTFPETHSVVLWKENEIIYLIDPSNETFSKSLLGAIKEQQLFNNVQGG